MTKTLDERVDLLLEHGAVNPKKWAIVHGYKEPSDDLDRCSDWHSEWERLRKHHLEETSFFLEVIENLRQRVLASKGK